MLVKVSTKSFFGIVPLLNKLLKNTKLKNYILQTETIYRFLITMQYPAYYNGRYNNPFHIGTHQSTFLTSAINSCVSAWISFGSSRNSSWSKLNKFSFLYISGLKKQSRNEFTFDSSDVKYVLNFPSSLSTILSSCSCVIRLVSIFEFYIITKLKH